MFGYQLAQLAAYTLLSNLRQLGRPIAGNAPTMGKIVYLIQQLWALEMQHNVGVILGTLSKLRWHTAQMKKFQICLKCCKKHVIALK